MQNAIAQKIKELREHFKLSQSEFARRTGLSLAYIMKLEEGVYQSLSLKSCKALADGFEMTLREFLDALGIINSDNRPSLQIIKHAFRNNGYTNDQIQEILRYAEFLKKQSK
jgi:transcriptional regulator with XRE-family HTH domain